MVKANFILTKSDFIQYQNCPKSLWLKHNRPDVYPAGSSSSFLVKLADEGYEVEAYAKKAVSQYSDAGAYNFQRDFLTSDGLYARCDIVKSNPDGSVDIFEIKSSTSVKDDSSHSHLKDAAFQVVTAQRAGERVGKVWIVHLNKGYVRSGDIDLNGLLTFADETVRVKALLHETQAEINTALGFLRRETIDENSCSCRYLSRANHCDSFDYFNPSIPKPSIYSLPRLFGEKLAAFVDEGRFDLASICPNEVSTQQSLIVKAHNEGNPFVDKVEIRAFFAQLKYPLHFLDYETFLSAVPIIDGYGPQEQLPFQFSLHVLQEDGRLEHSEYLADRPMKPDDLVKALRDAIQPTGSVFAWNKGFENTQNKNMGKQLPHAKDFLLDVVDRTVDLMDIFKTGYVDVGFDGSTSIKKVLPVLIPELSYQNLKVKDGGEAMEAWGKMIALTESAEKNKMRQSLLEYCKLDTLAMVRIYQFIDRLMK
ncbi:DUF2779 domain-containing protein [Yoonia vestfoldensis]|uniref:DUF2779 domain-containing protein n=1 Tax=Yoonia vestfoldensis TaxID=245188 RepID=A0A1Y0EBX8_9RHOB|nr:DUF2779 domain-containing protein [Yoonia vestfoldensis]ARU00881.1 hypothetical protein LOKVESSMR4R_01565 [Yoonia vestfoldensis]